MTRFPHFFALPYPLILGLALLGSSPSPAFPQSQQGQMSAQVSEQKQLILRDSNQSVWEVSDSRGRKTRIRELHQGAFYQDGNELKPSEEAFISLPQGFVAEKLPFKVLIHHNLKSRGGIQITLPDGQTIKSHALGLSYFDPSSGASVLLAETREDCMGELGPGPNQVTFRNAFDRESRIKGDIVYTVKANQFSQDVVFRAKLPQGPEEFGLGAHSRIELLTELVDSALPDVRNQRVLSVAPATASAASNHLNEHVDQTLHFGPKMHMGPGHAFGLDQPEQRTPVGKHIYPNMGQSGRTILVEGVEISKVWARLQLLPDQASQQRPRKGLVFRPGASGKAARSLPPPPPQKVVMRPSRPTQVASIASEDVDRVGFVMDYTLLITESDHVFAADETTYVSQNVTLGGTTVFEGGSVVKFTNGATITIEGSINCLTTMYRPVFFTSWDDISIGEYIHYGNRTNSWLICRALNVLSADNTLTHVRFRFFQEAVNFGALTGNTLDDVQMYSCGQGILSDGGFSLRNSLFHLVSTNFAGTSYTGICENVTLHDSSLLTGVGSDGTLVFTNSLIVKVSNTNNVTLINDHTVFLSSDTAVFQTNGAGAHYLPSLSSYSNAGTDNVTPSLLADLWQRTTAVPVVSTNVKFTNSYSVSRVNQLDSNQLDLGYHYAPVDAVFGNVVVSNASLTIPPGAVIAMCSTTGIWLQANGVLTAAGTQTEPIIFTQYQMVQECPWLMGPPAWTAEFISTFGSSNTPTANIRFAHFSNPSGPTTFYISADGRSSPGYHAGFNALNVRDSTFAGGSLSFLGWAGGAEWYGGLIWINCLFERVHIQVFDDAEATFRNCLFYKGGINVNKTGSHLLEFSSDAFHGCQISDATPANFLYTYNAFIGQTNRFGDVGYMEILVTNFVYDTGPFGRFYTPAGTALENAGNVTADERGLFHFTTSTNQTKETNSVVDIGFHYVAAIGDNSNTNLNDLNGDGVADYVADANGNGLVDSGELAWNFGDSDGDGVPDWKEHILGTNPFDDASVPPLRLGWWQFYSDEFAGQYGGQLPTASTNVSTAAAWTGYGVQIPASNSIARLAYADSEANGLANITWSRGTVRFSFKPNWSGTNVGGTGPGSFGRLIEMGEYATNSPTGWWGLYINPEGTRVHFGAQTNGSEATFLTNSIGWTSNTWHQLALVYTPSSSTLYIDGTNVASGAGVTIWPSKTQRAATGFSLGGDHAGGNLAKGVFEDLETFDYPLTSAEIRAGYDGPLQILRPSPFILYEDVATLIPNVFVGGHMRFYTCELSMRVTHGVLSVDTNSGVTILSGTNGVSTNLTLGGYASAVNSALGGLTYRGRTNFYGSDAMTLVLSAVLGTCTNSINLTVQAVNDRPTISTISNQTIYQDHSTAPLYFSVGDIDSPWNSLTVTAKSSNTNLVPNSTNNIVLGGNGIGRSVRIISAEGHSGTAYISVVVSDGSLSATNTFTLTVNPPDYQPTISSTSNWSTNVNQVIDGIPFTIGDPDSGTSGLGVFAISDNITLVPNANLTFSGSGADRTLTITPASDQFGLAGITVFVTNATGTNSTSFTVEFRSQTLTPYEALLNIKFGTNTHTGLGPDLEIFGNEDIWNTIEAATWVYTYDILPDQFGTIVPTSYWNSVGNLTWADGATSVVNVSVWDLTGVGSTGAEHPVLSEYIGSPYINVQSNYWLYVDGQPQYTTNYDEPIMDECWNVIGYNTYPVMIDYTNYFHPYFSIENLPWGKYDLIIYAYDGTNGQAFNVGSTVSYSPAIYIGMECAGTIAATFYGTNDFRINAIQLALHETNDIPSIAISTPEDTAAFTTADTIAITGTTSDSIGGVHQVAIFADSQMLGSATVSEGSFTFYWTNATVGDHTLSTVVVDEIGATNVASVDITVESPPSPSVYVDSDYDGVPDWLELIEGTNPNDAESVIFRRLGLWCFDDSGFIGASNQVPAAVVGVTNVPSWSTNAVLIPSDSNAVFLKYYEIETNGLPNINCRNGTVRFWFRPMWSSTNAGGTGPGTPSRFFELGQYSSNSPYGWWSLSMNSVGTAVVFGAQTNELSTNYFTNSITWSSNVWHQVVVTYTPTNSYLYVDGTNALGGPGFTIYPNAATREAGGFRIGSDLDGANTANGHFENLETFNYPLSSDEIWSNYNATIVVDSDGNGIGDVGEGSTGGAGVFRVYITRPPPSSPVP